MQSEKVAINFFFLKFFKMALKMKKKIFSLFFLRKKGSAGFASVVRISQLFTFLVDIGMPSSKKVNQRTQTAATTCRRSLK